MRNSRGSFRAHQHASVSRSIASAVSCFIDCMASLLFQYESAGAHHKTYKSATPKTIAAAAAASGSDPPENTVPTAPTIETSVAIAKPATATLRPVSAREIGGVSRAQIYIGSRLVEEEVRDTLCFRKCRYLIPRQSAQSSGRRKVVRTSTNSALIAIVSS